MTDSTGEDRYVVVSADCHAGADVQAYKPYLESRWDEEFDRWAAAFHDPWAELDTGDAELKMGVSSAEQSVNWDSRQRQRDLQAEGVVGEVLFPNTAPPFFPSGALTAASPTTCEEYERRWAGLKAHNRWLADFCADLPGRRAGVAQILLNDVADAIAEVEWVKEAGLTGGILIPILQPGSGIPMVHARVYDDLWSACARLGVPVNCHSAAAGYPVDSPLEDLVTARSLAWIELPFFYQRALWHFIFGGVFERHPEMRFVLTEQGVGWISKQLTGYDRLYRKAKINGRGERFFIGEVVDSMALSPSEYFTRNCKVGASFMVPREVNERYRLGVDAIMWGSDYPHSEGTFPYTREALRATFAEVPEAECRKMFGETAIEVYGLDRDVLRAAADQFGPTVGEIKVPLDHYPSMPEETACPVFDTVS